MQADPYDAQAMLQRGNVRAAPHRARITYTGAAPIAMIERGTIEQINARGRVTVRLADRRVFADIHSGSGGCVGDVVEGDMQPGMHSWRNVGSSILSVVHVVAIEPVADIDYAADAKPLGSRSLDQRRSDASPADQNSRRRLS